MSELVRAWIADADVFPDIPPRLKEELRHDAEGEGKSAAWEVEYQLQRLFGCRWQ